MVKSTVDRLTSFRAQLSRANETFAVSRNNDVSRTGETYEFIYFLKKKGFAHCVYFTVAYAQNFTYFTNTDTTTNYVLGIFQRNKHEHEHDDTNTTNTPI